MLNHNCNEYYYYYYHNYYYYCYTAVKSVIFNLFLGVFVNTS